MKRAGNLCQRYSEQFSFIKSNVLERPEISNLCWVEEVGKTLCLKGWTCTQEDLQILYIQADFQSSIASEMCQHGWVCMIPACKLLLLIYHSCLSTNRYKSGLNPIGNENGGSSFRRIIVIWAKRCFNLLLNAE